MLEGLLTTPVGMRLLLFVILYWNAGGGFLRQRVSSIGSVTSIGSFSHGY